MKCIQCGTNNNLRDRTNNQGRCKNCNHPFAFEPTSMEDFKFTDPFFAKVLNDISANNTLFFTPKQFLYFLDLRLKKKAFSWERMFFLCLFLYFFLSIWTLGFIGGWLSVVFGEITYLLALVLYNIGCIFYLFSLSNSPQRTPQTRQSSANLLILLGIVIFVVGGIISVSLNSAIGFFVAIPLGWLTFALGIVQRRKAAKVPNSFVISAGQVQGWLDSWYRANGEVPLMLSEPPRVLPSTVERSSQPPDVTAYSFDRLVVCDSDEIAQLLIANNFHFENNCAVLSISGYPQNIFGTTMQMVRRNRDLQVFALHDCSPTGIEIVHQLRTNPTWFAESDVVIVDVGLLPRQIMVARKNMFIQNSPESSQAAQYLAPHIRQTLSDEELQWLDKGNFVELESFSPQKLIQILQRRITNIQEISGEDSDSFAIEEREFGYIYTVDSFG